MAAGGKTTGRVGEAVQPRALAVEPTSILLKLDLITVGDRLRAVNSATADELAVSIKEIGLAQPIIVRPREGRFQLVLGAHRLEAFRRLGRTVIPAVIRDLSDLEAQQLEIDENLIRKGLTALDRIAFLAARVEVWAARNPDQVIRDGSLPPRSRGRPPKGFLKLEKNGGYVPELMGFVAETAADTGLSGRTIYRATMTVRGLPPETRARLHGTWIAANDAALRQLAGIGDPAEQAAVIDVLLDGKTKNVAAARAIAAGASPEAATRTPSQEIAAELRKLWAKATPSQREEALHWLSGQRLPKGWRITSPEENGDD